MTNDTQGRRPEGPGWYWYRGRVRDAIDFYERTYDIQDDVDQPVWVQNDYDVYIPGWQKADGWKYLSDYATPSDMPGDFVPLHPPVAAPEPDWSSAPEWAMWWAAWLPLRTGDDNSIWCEAKPEPNANGWLIALDGRKLSKVLNAGHVELPIGVDWRTTLRKRPEVGP